MEDTKYNFTQKIITKIISENDKLTLSVINDYCKNNNIIPNIISEEKLKEVLELGIAKKIKIENLEFQLSKANDKLKKIEEYLTSYESISTIQGLNDTKENKNLDKNTMVEMTNRYLKVHDKILSIIKGDE